jgi:hypothetical protein
VGTRLTIPVVQRPPPARALPAPDHAARAAHGVGGIGHHPVARAAADDQVGLAVQRVDRDLAAIRAVLSHHPPRPRLSLQVESDDDIFGDFDDWEVGFEEPEPDAPPPPPDYRATVVGARLTLIHWSPYLAIGPAQRSLLRERERAGVTVADLTTSGDPPRRELVVRFLARGGGARAERTLASWAAATGHSRLWLPDRVVPLSPPERFDQARTTCSNCGVEWREGDPEFWANVQQSGSFPTYCLLCGGDLPQWTLSRRGRARA